MQVLGYVRVSSEDQSDSGAGLEAQRRAIDAECKRRPLGSRPSVAQQFMEVGIFRRRRWIVPAAHLRLLEAAITTFPGLGRRAAIDRAVVRGVVGSTRQPRVVARPLTSEA